MRFSRVSTEWKDAVFGEKCFVIKVLVVADGDVHFNPDPTGFSLTLFCDVLRNSAAAWETIEVITAHRSAAETGAKLRSFKFDDPVNGLQVTDYDQVWLFGYLGEDTDKEKFSITPSEIDVITEFMNRGGGVFATGDHEDLGFAMCGQLPRVSKMRRWLFHKPSRNQDRAPGRDSSTRIDTLREGVAPGFEPADQEDAIPQEIRPKFFVNETQTAAEPHELLATSRFAITILPDHMHEGECVNPKEIKKRIDAGDQGLINDFPLRKDTGERVLPEVVAIASSAGGAFFPAKEIVPVDPRCYIVISAYDGHPVEHKKADGTVSHHLGRIVVDASFHHFVNLNLNAFIPKCVPKPEFGMFARYYQNTLRYLMPPEKQRLYFLHLLRALRFSPPLLEDLQNLSSKDWDDVVFAGTLVKKVISTDFSPAHARRCALVMLSNLETDQRTYLENIIDLWKQRNAADDSLFFINSEAMLIAVLGLSILALASNLPRNHYEVNRALIDLAAEGKSFRTLVADDFQLGVTQLQERVGELRKHLKRFSKTE